MHVVAKTLPTKQKTPKNEQSDLTHAQNLLLNGVISLGLTESGHLWLKPAHSQLDDSN